MRFCISPLFLQGDTVHKIYNHLQTVASNSNMELLTNAPLDLFQIDVSYFYKSDSKELNFFMHAPLVKLINLLKFFQLIKFSVYQSIGQNLTMMPHVEEYFLAVGQGHQSNC